MYRNILIATDGSKLAEMAVVHGVSLAKSTGAKVTALIVEAPFNVFNVPKSQIRQMPEAFAKHAEHVKQHATKVLNHVADVAKAAGVACRVNSGRGRSALSSDHQNGRGQELRFDRDGIAWAERDFSSSIGKRN